MMDLRRWLTQIWPTKNRILIAQYNALGGMPLVLADIAWRGGVYDAHPPTDSVWQAGIYEGRRQLALEIVKVAGANPQHLFALLESKPTGGPK